jgi:predicted lipoprotein with Yx(FWY)xxD motif
MNKKPLTLLLVVLAVLIVYFSYSTTSKRASYTAGPVVGYAYSPSYGHYLTDKNGRTLYILASDDSMISRCKGECLKKWPVFEFSDVPLETFDDALTKKIGVLIKEDGWYQFTYANHPLHYYVGDTAPGATNGLFQDNFGRLIKLTEDDLVY